MESIKNVYRIGMGPSSSHTMGPKRASAKFKLKYPEADSYQVTLYGSLALTGKGHMTDKAIFSELDEKKTKIIWKPRVFLKFHPNCMKFEALDKKKKIIGIGGLIE
jgi:L-serine dehydratase